MNAPLDASSTVDQEGPVSEHDTLAASFDLCWHLALYLAFASLHDRPNRNRPRIHLRCRLMPASCSKLPLPDWIDIRIILIT